MRKHDLVLLLPLLLSQAHQATANPANSYPLAIQYPPVIQHSSPYTYTLPQDTFTSSNGNLRYSADGLPDWLSFDSGSRTLSGTAPSDAQDGELWFQLIATDNLGPTSVNSSLEITSEAPVSISSTFSLANLLTSAGATSSSNTLVLTPNEPFYFAFEPSYFNGTNIRQYIAMSSSHSPLPIWLNYDSSSMSFSGTAPAVNSDLASSSYPISLFAVQVPGFSSASIDFNIQVGAHQFTTSVTAENATVIPDNVFYWNVPLDKMLLDNSTVAVSSISNITVAPDLDWLQVEESSATLKGTVPSSFENNNVTVTVTNVYDDSVQIQLSLLVNSTQQSSNETIFNGQTLPAINATVKEFFTYQIPSSALSSSPSRDLVKRESDSYSNISASCSPAAPWLSFTKSNLTLSGMVPDSFSGTTVSLVNSNDESDSLSLTIRAAGTTPVSTPASSASAGASSSPSSPKHSKGMSKNKIIAIVCGTVIPVVVLLLAALLFCCIKRRKDTKETKEDEINPEGVEPTEKPTNTFTPSVMNGSMMTVTGNQVYPGYAGSTDKFSVLTATTTTPVIRSLNPNGPGFTPAKAAEMNLLKLDNPKIPQMDFSGSPLSRTFSEAGSDATHIGEDDGAATNRHLASGTGALTGLGLTGANTNTTAPAEVSAAPANGTPMGQSRSEPLPTSTAVTAPEIPPRAQMRPSDSAAFHQPGKPRNSWRQQMSHERRWHSRNKGGSLASIGTDELISVRMIDPARLSTASARSQQQQQQQTSTINRENSSPILRAIGDDSDSEYSSYAVSDRPLSNDSLRHPGHSASIGSYSSSDGSELGYGQAVPYSNVGVNGEPELDAIAESPNLHAHRHEAVEMTRTARSAPEPAANRVSNLETLDLYRTASSGPESDAEEDHNLQPVLRNGEWEWQHKSSSSPVAAADADTSGYATTVLGNTPVMYGQAIDSPSSTLKGGSTPAMPQGHGVSASKLSAQEQEEEERRRRSQVRLSDPGGIRKVDEEDY